MDLTPLGLRVESQEVDVAEKRLDSLTESAKGAERAADGLAGGSKRAGGAIGGMLANIEKAIREQNMLLKAQNDASFAMSRQAAEAERAAATLAKVGVQARAAASHFDTLYDAANHDFASQYTRQMGGISAAHGKAAVSSKALTQATLGLTRQFADIGVTAAMGMSPLMILIQQGPQVADIFGQLKSQGIGVNDAFKGIGAQLGPLAPALLAVGTAVGIAAAGFALFEREIDKNTKYATTWGDTWNATVHVVGEMIMNGPIGDGLRWLSKAFGATLDAIVDGVMWFVDKTVGHFGAAYELIVKNWRRLPQVFGVIIQGAANITIQAVEGMINKVIDGVNFMLKAAGKETLAHINLPEIRVANAKLAGEYDKMAKAIEGNFRAGREGIADRIAKQADKEFLARQKATKATKDHEGALKDHTKAANDNADAMKKMEEASLAYADSLAKQVFEFGKSAIWLLEWEIAAQAAAAPTKELADRIRELGAQLVGLKKGEKAVQDLNKAMGEFITMPQPDFNTGAGHLAAAFGEAARQAADVRYAVDDIFYGIREKNWAGAFAGLFNVIKQLQAAFDATASKSQRLGAVGGVLTGVGGQIGGTAGSVIGSVGSGFSAAGAAAGMAGSFGAFGTAIAGLAGPIGIAVAGFSLLGSVLGKNKAKERAANEAAQQRAQDELARVTAIANQRRDLEVELMEAQGNAIGALAARRKAELAAMDPSLRALQELVWAEQKLAEERQKAVDTAQQAVDDARGRLSDAYDAEARALQEYIDRFKGWSESLNKFLKSLYAGPAAMLSPEEQYKAARSAFDSTSALAAGGDENAIRDLESVSQAYLDASKDYYASSKEYFADLEKVRSAVSATQGYAAQQVDVGQAQLTALNASVAGILNINSSVLSVRDALAGYQSAVMALAAAQAAQAANDNAAGGSGAKGADWASYIGTNSDVAAEYLRNQASAKGRDYLAQIGATSAEAFGQWHWNNNGKAEGREPFATGGSFTVGGSGGIDSQDFGPIALSPGEIVDVRRPGDMAKDGAEEKALLRAAIEELKRINAELRADKTQRAAMAEEQKEQNGRLEEAMARLSRTQAARAA